jgi:hypothetical protein
VKRLARVLIAGAFAAASFSCRAEVCAQVEVQARVEAAAGELTLADLLGRDSCLLFRNQAAQVKLGAVPRPGSMRVFAGGEVRRLLEGLGKAAVVKIPERVVVERAGNTKSCREIAQFVAGESGGGPKDLHCAAAHGIPREASLELAKSGWNAAAKRWEFALRCVRPGACVPFLVWAPEEKALVAAVSAPAATREAAAERLVKRGQRATLTWDGAGIRIVLPVTCLDAGSRGQLVRVRINSLRTLRAEVLGDGTLRARL